MSYIIFRGVSTSDLENVYVSKMPAHKKASRRMTEYYVKGRDGALHVDDGLANFDLEATLVLVNGQASARQIVNAWADGTGKLILSDQPGLAFRATVIQEIRWTRVPGNKLLINNVPTQTFFDTAKITFNCDPYLYEAQESVYELTEDTSLLNPGSATALPLIQVNGAGDVSFSVNGSEIQIADMTAGTPVYLDSETGYVYTEAGASSMTGNFPELDMGANAITLGDGISSLIITPRWRWV